MSLVLQIRLERCYARYHKAPLSADDLEMEDGWQLIEVPPEIDGWWERDESYDSDKKTAWYRYVIEADDGNRLAFLLSDGSVRAIGFCGAIEKYPSFLTGESRERLHLLALYHPTH
jgi:hypothetical protein